MSDEDLRGIERLLSASPDDRALRFKLVAALERAGERRRAYLELCKLARAGEETAEKRMEEWSPYSGGRIHTTATGFRRTPLRRAPRAERSVEVAIGNVVLGALSDDLLVLSGASKTIGVRVETLEVAWRSKGPVMAPLSLRGDDIVCRKGRPFESCELAVLDGKTGKTMASGAVGSSELLCDGDRALVPGHISQVIDTGSDFGRRLSQIELGYLGSRPDVTTLHLGKACFFRRADSVTVELHDLEEGRLLATRRLDAPEFLGAKADRNGIVFCSYSQAGELDPDTLETRWVLPGRSLPMFGSTVVITGHPTRERGHLGAIDRESGKFLWAFEVAWESLAMAGDVLYVACRSDAQSGYAIHALDVRARKRLFSIEGKVRSAMEPPAVLPLERRLIVVSRSVPRKSTITVFEE